jgi:hypothetical protein
MVKRHGYYIARTRTEHGDADLSARARGLWEREWAREHPPVEPEPEELPQPGPVDGVSVFVPAEGDAVHRLILHGIVRDLAVDAR